MAKLFGVIFDQNIGAVPLFAVFVVDHRVVERIDVTARLPHGGVHKNGRIQAHHIALKLYHCLPPILAKVVFEEHAILAVVVHGAQPVVELARLKNKTVLFGVGNDALKGLFGARGRHGGTRIKVWASCS